MNIFVIKTQILIKYYKKGKKAVTNSLYFVTNRLKIKFRFRNIKNKSEIKKKNFCKNWAKGVHH